MPTQCKSIEPALKVHLLWAKHSAISNGKTLNYCLRFQSSTSIENHRKCRLTAVSKLWVVRQLTLNHESEFGIWKGGLIRIQINTARYTKSRGCKNKYIVLSTMPNSGAKTTLKTVLQKEPGQVARDHCVQGLLCKEFGTNRIAFQCLMPVFSVGLIRLHRDKQLLLINDLLDVILS